MIFIDGSLTSLKGVSELVLEQIEQSGAKGVPQEVEVADVAPGDIGAGGALGNETVDMGIPLEVAAKRVKDADKAGGEKLLHIALMEHTKNNTANSRKETVQKGSVGKEEVPEFFGDGKDTVSVSTVDEFKGHGGSARNGIFVAAGGAKAAVAAERTKLKEAASRAGVKSAAKGGVATAQHFINVLNDGVPRM